MTSMGLSPNDLGYQDDDPFEVARIYIERYSDHAINYLATCKEPPVQQLLRQACKSKRHQYHIVMSQPPDGQEDTESQSSRRRTLSSNSRSPLTSSSSVILTSSENDNGLPKILYVMPGNGSNNPMTLRAKSLSGSDYLIKVSAVCTHLGLEYERFESEAQVRYNGNYQMSCGVVEISWARNMDQLKKRKVERTKFYLVEQLPDTEVVFGDSKPEANPDDDPSSLPFLSNSRSCSYTDGRAGEGSSELVRHGIGGLQQAVYTSSRTANSTAETVVRDDRRVSLLAKERQQSTASKMSKIPTPKTSTSSVRSASSPQPRVPSGQLQSTPTPPPPPVAQIGLPSGFRVEIFYGKCEWRIELQLDATGGEFYALLYKEIRRRTRRKLDRLTDQVRFTPDKNDLLDCQWVSLEERVVEDEWEKAAEWLRQFGKDRNIYAVVGPLPDDDDDDDDEGRR